MQEYEVLVTESRQMLYDIEAKDKEEALKKVEEQYYESKRLIGIDDDIRVDFEIDDDEKIKEDIELQIVYNKEEKQVYIGTESSSGTTYFCDNIDNLKVAISEYIDNYVDREKEEIEHDKEEELEK